ncbi:MAG: hypothetical protein K9J36_04565, partial [Bacteroidia bacterium]|nr:hypothetical protein [Bacteroidia bacterium]
MSILESLNRLRFPSLLLLGLAAILGVVQVSNAQAQPQPVQFSGLTLTSDSMSVVPSSTVLVKNRFKGTGSDL